MRGSIAEDYNLELQYRKPFADVWKEEKDNRIFGPLSERMGVRAPNGGELLVSDEEMEAVGRLTSLVKMGSRIEMLIYLARLLPCVLLLQSLKCDIHVTYQPGPRTQWILV